MQEEVFEAEIVPDSGDNTLNITLGTTFAVAIIFLLLGTNVGKILDDEALLKPVYLTGGKFHFTNDMSWNYTCQVKRGLYCQ